MEITKERALEVLNHWKEYQFAFPYKDVVIKMPKISTRYEGGKGFIEDYSIDDYTFTHLLCVAYDLEPKQKL
jgi:hypothetical protein